MATALCLFPDCQNVKRHGRSFRYCDVHLSTSALATLRNQTKKRDVIQAIKVEAGCADCGWTGLPVALDFDHREDEVKSFDIARSVSHVGLDRLLQEVAKCDVVCARCHRIRTFLRGQHRHNDDGRRVVL